MRECMKGVYRVCSGIFVGRSIAPVLGHHCRFHVDLSLLTCKYLARIIHD